MAVIKKIIRVETHTNQQTQQPYKITIVELEDGSEATGYGEDYKVGDAVEHYHHARYNRNKIKKRLTNQNK